jgi:hypothetical protein
MAAAAHPRSSKPLMSRSSSCCAASGTPVALIAPVVSPKAIASLTPVTVRHDDYQMREGGGRELRDER